PSVVVTGDAFARLGVPGKAADVRHEHARLPGNVRAHVPGVGRREQGQVRDRVDVVDPGVLGLDGGVDRNEVSRPQVGDAVGDPVDVLLDRHEHVDEHRRAAGSGDGEEVREAGGRDAEVRARPGGPLVTELHAPGAGD